MQLSQINTTTNNFGHLHTREKRQNDCKQNRAKKLVPLAGAFIGAIAPIVIFNKIDKKPLNLDGKMLQKLKSLGEYFAIDDFKRIVSSGIFAVGGGLLGGLAVDKNKENQKEKIKEATFEAINITLPTIIAAGVKKFLETKNLDKGIGKIAPFVIGVGAGIPLALKISEKIKKAAFKDDKTQPRKFHPKDFLVHTDDMVDALVLLQVPLVKKLQIDKILALIYTKCGYEAGTKKAENK